MRIRAAVIALLVASVPAQAGLWMSENGSKAYLSGHVDAGDDTRFEEFLKRPRAQKLKTIYLSGPGGYVAPALKIGILIRKSGLATAVQADRANCDSACNLIFAAGVKRYYVRGEGVAEGHNSLYGLGYHPSHTLDQTRRIGAFSDRGTAAMTAYYRAMGAPRAAELAAKAAFNTMYRPSGKTALSLNIATSLGDPPD